MNVSPSLAVSSRSDTRDRSTSCLPAEESSPTRSQSDPAEPPRGAATISRRDFLLGSASALVLTALGSSRVAHAAASKLRIGFILPETGPLAGEATSLFSGFQLFLKEHATEASEFEILRRDAGPQDQKTLEALTELVVNREVHLLVAPPSVAGSEKAVHAVTGSNVILLVTNPAVRLVGGEICLPGSFRVCANNFQEGQPLAGWALRNVGRKVFITGEDDEQGNEQADYFAYGFEKAGGAFGDRLMLSSETAKVQSLLEAIRKTEPNMVFASFQGNAAAGFLKAMRATPATSNLPIIGPDSLTQFPGTLSLVGESCKGVRTLTSVEDPVQFLERIKKSSSGIVVSIARAAQGYDIGTIAGHLSQQVNLWSSDFPKVIASLEGLEIQGPRGRITFDANHELILKMMIQKWNFSGGSPSQEVVARLEPIRTPDFGCGHIGFPKKPDVDRPDEEPNWDEKEE